MFRYTFFLENQSQGWSETLFRAGPFTGSDSIFLQQYINRRLELMATTCRIMGVRGSNVDHARDIDIYPIPLEGRAGAWLYGGGGGSGDPGAATAPEDSFTALLLRLTDGAQHYRTFQMLAFPDHIFSQSTIVPSELPLVTARLNNWMSALTQAGFGMKNQGAPSATGRISSFPDKTADNQLVCIGLKGPIPAAGSYVTFGAVKPWNFLNRKFKVASTAPGDAANDGYVYLAGTASRNTFGPVEGGTYKVPTYGLAVLTSYTISRLTSRKTGGLFTTVRGRR